MPQDLLNLIIKIIEWFTRSSDDRIERTAQRTVQLLHEGWQPPQSNEKEAPIDTEEVCQLFQISRKTLSDWRAKGKIPSFKVGKRVYFFKSEVLEAVQGGRRKEGYGNRRNAKGRTLHASKAA